MKQGAMDRPLRILMTADAIGGVWTYALELAAALAPHGVEIAWATMGAMPSDAQQAELARLPHVTHFFNDGKLEWMDEPWAAVDAAGDWLLELAADFQPDVIHLNGYAHAALPWEAPVLVVAHSCVRSWWAAVKGERAPASWAEYSRRVGHGLKAADLVIAPTHAMLAALREEYAFDTPSRVIPNCRRAALFAPATKEPMIFSAGRLWDEAKNTTLLEEIAPRLAWPVHLAGAHRKPRASSGATLLGELAPVDLARHLTSAGIYAAPARYEPFGLGILEAALAGCALVLSDLASLREIWHDAALFLPATDAEAWVNALNALAADPARRCDLAARSHSRALTFTPAKCAGAYLAAYRGLLSARPALAPCCP